MGLRNTINAASGVNSSDRSTINNMLTGFLILLQLNTINYIPLGSGIMNKLKQADNFTNNHARLYPWY
jgi:hypothetical protein